MRVHLAETEVSEKVVCGRSTVGVAYTVNKNQATCKACARVHKLKKAAARARKWAWLLYYA